MTAWQRFAAWWQRWWRAVAGVGALVAGVLGVLVLRRRPPSATVEPVPPDPSPALKPLGEIGPSVREIEEVERREGAREAKEAADAHRAIDAADSIGDVNAVLYGVAKSRDSGGPPPAPAGGASAPGRNRRDG